MLFNAIKISRNIFLPYCPPLQKLELQICTFKVRLITCRDSIKCLRVKPLGQALYVHILDAWINEGMQAQTVSYFFRSLGYLQTEVPIGDCA